MESPAPDTHHLLILAELSRQAYPQEAVALVFDNRVEPLSNRHPSPAQHFTIAPGEVMKALDRGGRLRALFHSHPQGQETPSRLDAEAWAPGGQPVWGAARMWIGVMRAGKIAAVHQFDWRASAEGREEAGFVEEAVWGIPETD